MKQRVKSLILIFLVILLVGVAWVIHVLYASFHFAGSTPNETAAILIHDFKYGSRAVSQAKTYGDYILSPLRESSNNFELLNKRNAFVVAEVLASNNSEESQQLLIELYERKTRLAQTVGAIGLAAHGCLPEHGVKFLVESIETAEEDSIIELAIIALGKEQNELALPVLFKSLKTLSNYAIPASACRSIAYIGNKNAIPILRDCLQNPNFHATPAAFHALMILGDRTSVPLAIQRVDSKNKHRASGGIVRELEEITGQHFGFNRRRWQEWWETVSESWQIPLINQPQDWVIFQKKRRCQPVHFTISTNSTPKTRDKPQP